MILISSALHNQSADLRRNYIVSDTSSARDENINSNNNTNNCWRLIDKYGHIRLILRRES